MILRYCGLFSLMRDGWRWRTCILLLLATLLAILVEHPSMIAGAALDENRHERSYQVELDAYPQQPDASTFTIQQQDSQSPSHSNQNQIPITPATSSSPSSSSPPTDSNHQLASHQEPAVQTPQSTVYAPIPAHILDDDIPSLFQFDSSRLHNDRDDTAELLPARALTTAFTSFVLRVSRRVTSAGMWQPPSQKRPSRNDHSAADDSSESTPIRPPPASSLTVVSTTLNLCVSAHYRERPGLDVYRGLQFHVLPGPSFHRGSLSALSEAYGAQAIGFEQAFHSIHDQRILVDGLADGQIAFHPDTSPLAESNHFPGYGPIHQLKTMSGQHNENWIIYSSGFYDEQHQRVVHQVAIYSLLVHVWNDPVYAKELVEQQKLAEELGLPVPPLSMNAHGLRVRVQADFTIRPLQFGRSIVRESFLPHPMHLSPEEADIMYGSGLGVHSAKKEELSSTIRFAKVVDYAMYQQRKFIFMGVAYEDGFIRIFGRNGTLRNEIHSRNSTILQISMSNWGSSTTTDSGHGGGARDANSGLNGAQNGNQLLLYTTPSGIGMVKMARIYNEIDQYCKWDTHAPYGIKSGYDISAVSFDLVSQSIIYIVSHRDQQLYVLNSRLGWNPDLANPAPFDESGHRRIEEGGNRCRMSAEIPISLSRAAASLSKLATSSSSFFVPQYDLLSLRGVLLLSSSIGGSLMIFNTSAINEIPQEVGVEFISERALLPPMQTVDELSTRHIHLSHLVADRIDLLFVGHVYNGTSGAACSTSTPSPAASPINILQLFLKQYDPYHSDSSSWSLNWLTRSRTPLFIIGLIIFFGYNYLQKKKKQMEAELGEEEDFAIASRKRKQKGGGKFGSTPSATDMYNSMSESSELRQAASNSDPFDSQSFMADFIAWQKTNEGQAVKNSIRSGPAGNAARYYDILERDRARLGASSRSSYKPHSRQFHPPPIPKVDYKNAESFERSRIEMRRILNAMDQKDSKHSGSTAASSSSQPDQHDSIFTANTYPLDELVSLDPTDGMQHEGHGFDRENYDSDDEEPPTQDELDQQQQPQPDEQEGDNNDVDDPDGDGPAYHGAYDDYQYQHDQYRRDPNPRQTAANIAAATARRRQQQPSASRIIDEVNAASADKNEPDEDDGTIPTSNTYPIDTILTDEYDRDHDPLAEVDPDELASERAWRTMDSRSARSGPLPPRDAPMDVTSRIGGYGHSGDDISQYDLSQLHDHSSGKIYDDELVYDEDQPEDEDEDDDGGIPMDPSDGFTLDGPSGNHHQRLVTDDLVNDEADAAAGEEWIEEEAMTSTSNEAELVRRTNTNEADHDHNSI